MPIIKSAIKRVRSAERRRKRNVSAQRNCKDLMKKFTKLVEQGDQEEAKKLYPQLQKSLDMAVKKNHLHTNNVGRKKSNFAKMIAKESTPKSAPKKVATTKKVEEK